MVDALASGASVLRDVEVRVFSRVPIVNPKETDPAVSFYNHMRYNTSYHPYERPDHTPKNR